MTVTIRSDNIGLLASSVLAVDGGECFRMEMAQETLFPTQVRLRRIDPDNNVWRFYALTIEHTLFGEWAVLRSWGRIGTTGNRRLDIVSGPGEALDVIGRIRNAKIRRGYVIVWSL